METITIRQRGLAPLFFGVALAVVAVVLWRGVGDWAGLIVGALALLVLLGRHDFRVEGNARAAMWWTLLGLPLVKLRGTEPPSVREVVLSKEVRRGSKGRTYHVFPVRLAGATTPLDLWVGRSHAEGRHLAEGAARALRKPLRDEALGEPVVRQPAELDLSLGERLRARGRAPAVPPLPAGSPITLTRGEETVLTLPGTKPPALAVALGLGVPLLIAAFFYAVPTGEARFIGVGIALVVFGFFAWGLVAAARTSRLTLGPDAVASRGRGAGRRIPLARLEEVRIDGEDVVLLSDEVTLVVPYDCRDEAEARFLAGAVALAAWHHPGGRLPHFSPAVGTSGEPLDGGERPDAQGAPATSTGVGAAGRNVRLKPRQARSAGIGLFLAAAALLGVAGWLGAGNLRFMEHAATAPGVVVELAASRGSKGGTRYSAIVRWQPLEGEPHMLRSRTSSSTPLYEVGEQVTVLYDPADPEEARIRAFSELWLPTAITGGMGLLFLFIGGATLAFGRGR